MSKISASSLRGDIPPPPAAIGLGCVTFGREIDSAAAFTMMDHALNRGIEDFDTAAAYGQGASEAIVGDWLASRLVRERVKVATKLLPPYSPEKIESGLAASLARLKSESIDTLFLHRWDETAIEPPTLRALDAVMGSGRVRHLGASNFSAAQLEDALARQAEIGARPFTALQNIHNFAVRGIDEPTRALCAAHAVTIVTYSPLGAGFLTGKHEARVQPGSRFDIIPGHQRVYFHDAARQRLARLKEVAAVTGESVVHLALAWALHQPGIDLVLGGGRTPAQLDQVLAARDFNHRAIFRQLDAEWPAGSPLP